MGVDFSAIKLPFGPTDLLSSGVSLLGVLGGFVLLGLAIAFVPKLIGIIRVAAQSRNGKNS
ncbi:hypothetical protein COL26_00515 [Bacillus thuringiensis]|uniref:Uncharacterized protein n=2 Tax=Bacillus cereus group TaxID=86661 RepID=A0AB34DCB6_BACCE|nr:MULTISPECIES: hypothetical protein [Bacillus cereus group]ETT86136.1 hypothetical protein C175_03908 [Bacillus cereus]KAB2500389.1 hypothetical protein F8158_08690 [Bacillus cereus]OOR37178.1 hypothetical protein BW895_28275 [Bacillus cereus]PER51135.1 hypothetical protein CN495_19860 [Bacillus thuringiensis]PEU90173.1 hypothetical protein CN411_09965 [Bacillus thuringiensis]